MSRRAGFGAVVVVSALLLVGCSTSDPEPTATTPTPVSSPAPVAEETVPPDPVRVNKDAATSAYLNYVEVQNAVAQDYFNGWEEKVLPLTSGAHFDWVYWYFSQVVDLGRHQVGAEAARSVTVVEYYEDPTGGGHEQVILNVCLDSTDVQSIGADGTNKLVPGTMGRFVTRVVMQRQTNFDAQGGAMEDPYAQSWWRVAELDRDLDSSC